MEFARGLLIIGAVIAIFLVGIAMFQERLLYFPAWAPLGEMPSNLEPWPEPADYRGLLAAPDADTSQVRGTVIVFHGNAGHAGHRDYYATALNQAGLRVVLAEYPGYGPRAGEPGERVLVDDAVDTIAKAAARFGPPIIVLGESLGAAVAAAATARDPAKVDGLLLITPWDRLESVASHHYPWLPVKWLLRDRYDTVAHLRNVSIPVVIVLAERDEIVPARLGRLLHETLDQPHALISIPGAGHNDWVSRINGAWWRNTLAPLLPAAARRADSAREAEPSQPRK
jgi:uncharacterized protein